MSLDGGRPPEAPPRLVDGDDAVATLLREAAPQFASPQPRARELAPPGRGAARRWVLAPLALAAAGAAGLLLHARGPAVRPAP
jgi:hypothetical protein